MFSTFLGYYLRGGGGGGLPRDGYTHNLLMQFFTLGSSKIEVFKSCFFDIVTTLKAHPRYVKHVLGHIYVFFNLFGVLPRPGRGGGGSQGMGTHTTCSCSFSPWAAQKSKFSKLVFLIL